MGSLAVLVEAQLKLNPFADAVFVFSNRRFTAVMVLYWARCTPAEQPRVGRIRLMDK
jgi:transposase